MKINVKNTDFAEFGNISFFCRIVGTKPSMVLKLGHFRK